MKVCDNGESTGERYMLVLDCHGWLLGRHTKKQEQGMPNQKYAIIRKHSGLHK